MNVASSSRSTSGWVLVSRSASTCGQSISWAVVIACFLCSSDFGRSLEESRDDLHLSGYDTPDLTNGSDSYTTLVDATQPNGQPPRVRGPGRHTDRQGRTNHGRPSGTEPVGD